MIGLGISDDEEEAVDYGSVDDAESVKVTAPRLHSGSSASDSSGEDDEDREPPSVWLGNV